MCKLRYYFLSLFILFVSNNAPALDCGGGPPFFELVEQVDLIVRGKILNHPSSSHPLSSIEMEVLEIYKGTTEALKIQLFSDGYEGPVLSQFPIGTEWIFTLKRMEGDGISDNQYIMPFACWESFLKVEGTVFGNLINTEKYKQQRVSLDEFRNMLVMFTPNNANAPDRCSEGAPFFKFIEQVDLIVRGKIIAFYSKDSFPSSSVEMEVLEIYKGTTEALKIRIFTDYLAQSSIGTEWIFSLKQMEGDGMFDNQYIMPLNNCWGSYFGYYLQVETSVVGNLSNTEHYAQQSVTLNEFRNLVQYIDSKPSLTDDERVQVGRQQCIDDPASCGISNDDCLQEASYDPTTGKLHIPCLKVPSASGGMTTYEVNFSQRIPSFVFDLDLNNIKVH